MAALYNEIAYYMKNELRHPKSSILLMGKNCQLLKKYLTDYELTILEEVDVSQLQRLKTESFDAAVILQAFGNFAEYKDARAFMSALISSVKTGGLVQIYEYTGDAALNLSQYTNRFESFRLDSTKVSYGFQMLWEQALQDAIYRKNDWNDHCWMLTKCEFPVQKTDKASVREFLDQNQYTEFGIRAYEWIFGSGFISPGGAAQNAQFVAQLDLKPGETVLDIGCGIGGNAFQIAREYGAHVMGVDLSSNVVTMACDRACLRRDTRVRFMIADITKYDFPPNTFEVIYSRDAIIHIPDKKDLFSKCFKWLKPGGRLLITDYMTGEKEFTEEFKEYLAQRQYALWTLNGYKDAAKSAGFSQIQAVDLTDQFKSTIENEMQRATDNKHEFMQMFSAEKFDHLMEGWKNKVRYIANGDHKWGMIKALKN